MAEEHSASAIGGGNKKTILLVMKDGFFIYIGIFRLAYSTKSPFVVIDHWLGVILNCFYLIAQITKPLFMNTELLSNLNWLHVLVATAAYFMLGAVWYSFLFQKKWIEYQGIDMTNPDGKKGVGAIMALSFLGFFVICAGLAVIAARMNLEGGAVSGIKLGLLTGVLAKAYVLVTDSCLALRARLRRARSELLTLGIHPLQ